MNSVILSGYLTRNPEIRISEKDGKQLKTSHYTLAVRRPITGADQADFISCVAFRNQADIAEKYLSQGRKIAIRGHLRADSYINKAGNKIYTTDVIIDEMEFADGKGSKNSDAGSAVSKDSTGTNDFMDIPEGIEDDLPFK
ncbi:single-stranded DNA-binding protein [Clostridium sp. CAG:264]|jgi:single-strand binding protein|nr:single-stranded DNA-binding protein [Clostridium sp. CAG:264]